jgi:hypothetical protein
VVVAGVVDKASQVVAGVLINKTATHLLSKNHKQHQRLPVETTAMIPSRSSIASH